jgi:general secretion pathway protein K
MNTLQRRLGRDLRSSIIVGARARGAAVVMAMLVVAVTASLVAGVFWRQNVLIRQAENELSYAQARWLLRGAIDWAGVILGEDARTSQVDHLGESWAVPLAETRLNEDDGRQPLYLAGQIRDAQAKLNLRNLAAAGGVVQNEVDAFRRLLAIIGVDQTLADHVAQRVLASVALMNGRAPTMIAVSSVQDLLAVEGMTPEAIERLRPYVTALPLPTPVNANTASPEVLSARIANLSLADARRLAASRDRSYFRDLSDVLTRLGSTPLTAGNDEIVVATRYFAVEGTVSYGRATLHADALLQRNANSVEVLWLREPV